MMIEKYINPQITVLSNVVNELFNKYVGRYKTLLLIFLFL